MTVEQLFPASSSSFLGEKPNLWKPTPLCLQVLASTAIQTRKPPAAGFSQLYVKAESALVNEKQLTRD